MKLISVVTPCFNEQDNINEIYQAVKYEFSTLNDYRYEHVFIDNASTDNTVLMLKTLAATDKNVKVILNSRNFGSVRSPMHGILQAKGDAVIYMAADFQDPPPMIPDLIKKWEEGYKIVVGVKPKSDESRFVFFIRNLYYRLAKKISDIKVISNFTGFGLYDQVVITILNSFNDSYPYFRGMISEIGYDVAEIPFHQPVRQRGVSKLNFFMLYDLAMLGITTHSKLPLRLVTLCGFVFSLISFSISISYILLKLFFWHSFSLGLAPILIGSFFFFSLQMLFVGILGEYIISIHAQVLNRPLVIEKERINFEN